MLLSDIFLPDTIKIYSGNVSKDAVFEELVDSIASRHKEIDSHLLYDLILEREWVMSTAIGNDKGNSKIAIPHAVYPRSKAIFGALAISRNGIDYDTEGLQTKPVHLIFLLVLGSEVMEEHLRIMSSIVSLAEKDFFTQLYGVKTAVEASQLLRSNNL
ncbi:MAG: PTS sugar transporter subunit IIA [Spirochaetaceae bacterium]|jgi:mannitol/fructose-specific phosphotransferase system IIA component (Ntr-type)|nr:PTS sugar transporter subunit IIA [Spirochaetaceae bacterium]